MGRIRPDRSCNLLELDVAGVVVVVVVASNNREMESCWSPSASPMGRTISALRPYVARGEVV